MARITQDEIEISLPYITNRIWRKARHFFGKHYVYSKENSDTFYCALCPKTFTFDKILKMAHKLKSTGNSRRRLDMVTIANNQLSEHMYEADADRILLAYQQEPDYANNLLLRLIAYAFEQGHKNGYITAKEA